ncbi:unnamed protein product [Amoebophrya sp. A25]|nr:unnamed protein product [Amoebophrya sp. A25]|eukprot:GSA25T00024234001.1
MMSMTAGVYSSHCSWLFVASFVALLGVAFAGTTDVARCDTEIIQFLDQTRRPDTSAKSPPLNGDANFDAPRIGFGGFETLDVPLHSLFPYLQCYYQEGVYRDGKFLSTSFLASREDLLARLHRVKVLLDSETPDIDVPTPEEIEFVSVADLDKALRNTLLRALQSRVVKDEVDSGNKKDLNAWIAAIRATEKASAFAEGREDFEEKQNEPNGFLEVKATTSNDSGSGSSSCESLDTIHTLQPASLMFVVPVDGRLPDSSTSTSDEMTLGWFRKNQRYQHQQFLPENLQESVWAPMLAKSEFWMLVRAVPLLQSLLKYEALLLTFPSEDTFGFASEDTRTPTRNLLWVSFVLLHEYRIINPALRALESMVLTAVGKHQTRSKDLFPLGVEQQIEQEQDALPGGLCRRRHFHIHLTDFVGTGRQMRVPSTLAAVRNAVQVQSQTRVASCFAEEKEVSSLVEDRTSSSNQVSDIVEETVTTGSSVDHEQRTTSPDKRRAMDETLVIVAGGSVSRNAQSVVQAHLHRYFSTVDSRCSRAHNYQVAAHPSRAEVTSLIEGGDESSSEVVFDFEFVVSSLSLVAPPGFGLQLQLPRRLQTHTGESSALSRQSTSCSFSIAHYSSSFEHRHSGTVLVPQWRLFGHWWNTSDELVKCIDRAIVRADAIMMEEAETIIAKKPSLSAVGPPEDSPFLGPVAATDSRPVLGPVNKHPAVTKCDTTRGDSKKMNHQEVASCVAEQFVTAKKIVLGEFTEVELIPYKVDRAAGVKKEVSS